KPSAWGAGAAMRSAPHSPPRQINKRALRAAERHTPQQHVELIHGPPDVFPCPLLHLILPVAVDPPGLDASCPPPLSMLERRRRHRPSLPGTIPSAGRAAVSCSRVAEGADRPPSQAPRDGVIDVYRQRKETIPMAIASRPKIADPKTSPKDVLAQAKDLQVKMV